MKRHRRELSINVVIEGFIFRNNNQYALSLLYLHILETRMGLPKPRIMFYCEYCVLYRFY